MKRLLHKDVAILLAWFIGFLLVIILLGGCSLLKVKLEQPNAPAPLPPAPPDTTTIISTDTLPPVWDSKGLLDTATAAVETAKKSADLQRDEFNDRDSAAMANIADDRDYWRSKAYQKEDDLADTRRQLKELAALVERLTKELKDRPPSTVKTVERVITRSSQQPADNMTMAITGLLSLVLGSLATKYLGKYLNK